MTSLDALNVDFRDFLRERIAEDARFLIVGAYALAFLTEITGVTFADAWATRIAADFDGVEVCFLGRDALIHNKRATGRTKDLADAERLEG